MSWPTTPVANSAAVRSNSPTLISTAQSLKRQVRSRGGQRFAIGLDYTNLRRVDLAPLWAALIALRGQYNTTTIVVPGYSDTPQGTWSGTPLVKGAGQTGRSVIIDGFTHGQAGVAKAGDFIKFADTKVYMITADANANGSGEATVSIEPGLIVSPADNEPVVSSNVAFTCALTTDTSELPLKPPVLADLSLSFMEAY